MTESPSKGGLPVSKGVEDRSQSVDVAQGGHEPLALPPACSGAMKAGVPRTAPDSGHTAIALDPLRQPEVTDVWLALLVDQDVGGLEVPVEDARWWAWWTASAIVTMILGGGSGVGGIR